MPVNSCGHRDHRDSCHKSTKLRQVGYYKLQITTDLPLQLREKSVMFVNNVLATAA